MSETPINDALTRETAGLDDAEHIVRLDELSRSLELAANAMEEALVATWDELRSFGDNPDEPDATRELVQAALAQYRKLKP